MATLGFWCRLLSLLSLLSTVLDATATGERSRSRQKRYLVFPSGASLQMVFEFLVPTVNPNPWLYGWTLGTAYELPSEAKEILEKVKPMRMIPEATSLPPPTRPPEQQNSDYRDEYDQGQTLMADDMMEGGNSKMKVYYVRHKNPPLVNKKYYYKDYSGYSMPQEVLLHRRHRRDMYLKLESLFSGARMGGRACVLRALCEAGQRRAGGAKGSFLSELLHVLFTLPPALADEEDIYVKKSHSGILKHYDTAHATTEVCEEVYPECTGSLFDLWAGDREL